MSFIISANEGAEHTSFVRTTAASALSRARELERQGLQNVRITDDDGTLFTASEFNDRYMRRPPPA